MPFDGREIAAIFAGGIVGALARAKVVEALPRHDGQWPWATFAVNIVGAFLLGYFATRLQERLPLSAYRRPLLGTGFCGALTTFSTMQVELLRDARRATTIALARSATRRRASPLGFARRRDGDRARPPRAGASHERRRAGSASRLLGGVGRGGALPARRRGRRARSARSFPFGHAGRQHHRRVRARRARRRSRSAATRCVLAGTGAARLVHDVLDVDARDASGSARTASCGAARGELRRQPRRSASRAAALGPARSGARL